MANSKIQLSVGYRQNKNVQSKGYNKYYAEVIAVETLSTRGLAQHIADHGRMLRCCVY